MTEEKTEDQNNLNEEKNTAKTEAKSTNTNQDKQEDSKATKVKSEDNPKKEAKQEASSGESKKSEKVSKKSEKKSSGKKKSILDGPIEINYKSIIVTCACGAEFDSGSTLDKIHVDICSQCHPYFTGESKILDSEGRVDKFRKKYSNYAKK